MKKAFTVHSAATFMFLCLHIHVPGIESAAQQKYSDGRPDAFVGLQPMSWWDPSRAFPNRSELHPLEGVRFSVIKRREPDVDGYSWLHGVAVVWHKGKLFTFFGNNPGPENTTIEVARERRSDDGGRTWGPVRMMATHTEKYGRSHGAFHSHGGNLWAFVGEIGNDASGNIRGYVATLAYVLDEKTDEWKTKGLVAKDFWPCDEPAQMKDGNWIMGGMSDCVNNKAIPTVAVSHRDDFTKWDVIKIPLPEGKQLWGETTVIVEEEHVLALVRNRGQALASISRDGGRTWSVCKPSGLHTPSTKIYAGRLSTGERYAIGTFVSDHSQNERMTANRDPLTIAVSRPGESQFHTIFKIRGDVFPEGPGESAPGAALSYPYAVEHKGHLYVVYSNDGGRGNNKNSAEMAVIPISSFKIQSN
jgi:hypothetical protein